MCVCLWVFRNGKMWQNVAGTGGAVFFLLFSFLLFVNSCSFSWLLLLLLVCTPPLTFLGPSVSLCMCAWLLLFCLLTLRSFIIYFLFVLFALVHLLLMLLPNSGLILQFFPQVLVSAVNRSKRFFPSFLLRLVAQCVS